MTSAKPQASPATILAARLRKLATGQTELRVQHPVKKSFCVRFDRGNFRRLLCRVGLHGKAVCVEVPVQIRQGQAVHTFQSVSVCPHCGRDEWRARRDPD